MSHKAPNENLPRSTDNAIILKGEHTHTHTNALEHNQATNHLPTTVVEALKMRNAASYSYNLHTTRLSDNVIHYYVTDNK